MTDTESDSVTSPYDENDPFVTEDPSFDDDFYGAEYASPAEEVLEEASYPADTLDDSPEDSLVEGVAEEPSEAEAAEQVEAHDATPTWRHVASVVGRAFVPRKVLARSQSSKNDALDIKSVASKMAGYTHITLSALSPKQTVKNLMDRPLFSYRMVIIISAILTIFGLVMVQSASAVKGIVTEGSAYGLFTAQLIFVIIGVVLFGFALRLRMSFVRATAFISLLVTTIALVMVLIPGLGTEVNKSRRWFSILGISLQPSELVKVALCVWGAHLLATRRRERAQYVELLVPLLPVAALISVLIILEPNLSTMIIIVLIVGALLWFVGVPLRLFAFMMVTAIVIFGVLAITAGYRSTRVMTYLGQINDSQGAGYQSQQARFALANGGFFGSGLGQSKAKWNYLPNEHNDFIFAVVGEELGFVGAVSLIALFAILTVVGIRIALRSVDPFLRLLSGSITVLIAGQAAINIGYVVGLLPVTGVQLPLISAGGTSAFTNLFLLGLLANVARHEPAAIAALQEERKISRKLFALPIPQEYQPSSALERHRNKRNQVGSKKAEPQAPNRKAAAVTRKDKYYSRSAPEFTRANRTYSKPTEVYREFLDNHREDPYYQRVYRGASSPRYYPQHNSARVPASARFTPARYSSQDAYQPVGARDSYSYRPQGESGLSWDRYDESDFSDYPTVRREDRSRSRGRRDIERTRTGPIAVTRKNTFRDRQL